MGGYAGYVWGSFGVTALIMVANPSWSPVVEEYPRPSETPVACRIAQRFRKQFRMKTRHKRLALIGGALAILGIIAALVLNALNSNIALYISPTDVAAKAPGTRSSASAAWSGRGLKRQADGVTVSFIVTDTDKDLGQPTRASCRICSKR